MYIEHWETLKTGGFKFKIEDVRVIKEEVKDEIMVQHVKKY